MHQKITSEIFQVGGAGFTAAEDAAIYLVCFNGEAALVDAGCGGEMKRLLANINECDVDPAAIQYLLLTHCLYDHTGGAAALRKAIACRSVAHKLDAAFLEAGDDTVTAAGWYGARIKPVPVDWKLSDPQTEILLGGRAVTALHIPGHSPGSVAFLTESDGKKILFGQDVHGPLHPDLKSNHKDYISSLNSLLLLDADILCEGHFGVYSGKDAVRNFIRSFL